MIRLQVAVSKKKFKRRIGIILSFSVLFLLMAVLVVVMNLTLHGEVNSERWKVIFGLLSIAILVGLPVIHILLVRNHFDSVMVYKDGEIVDYSNIINARRRVALGDIEQIVLWSDASNKSTRQYRFKLKKTGRWKSPVFNQLLGKDFYLNDWIVERADLDELISVIEADIRENRNQY